MPPAHGWARLDRLRFVPVKNSNVVAFTEQYTKFYDGKGEPNDRRDAEFFWAYEVRKNLPKDNPEFDRLLSQVKSPANEQFWAERMDPVAHRLRNQLEAQSGCWAFPREPTPDERRADPGLLILGDSSWSIVLPGYNLMPITAIEFSTFVITLLMSNPSYHFKYSTITALWATLVLKVYHFEWEDIKSAKLSDMGFSSNAGTAVSTPTPTMAGQAINPVVGSEVALIEGLEKEVALLKRQVGTLKGRYRN